MATRKRVNCPTCGRWPIQAPHYGPGWFWCKACVRAFQRGKYDPHPVTRVKIMTRTEEGE